ncbi:replication protein RepA [Xanthomonas sp. NCPPB 2632]|uniref:replication protein RepA n=1 Tax=Xanthomonas sp. NCPPB 2632 TaxID=3240912 RepID=UPI00351327AA
MALEEQPAYGTYMPTAMIFASLPHSEPDDAFFDRRSDAHTLSIVNDPRIGLPYGKIPRVITAFLCTQAKLQAKTTNDRRIYLGRSQAEFAKKLGLSSTGGERGGLTRLKDQCTRLFTSKITLIRKTDVSDRFKNVIIADEGELWGLNNAEAPSLWKSWIELSEKFYTECIEHAVPIKMDIINALRSPMAIDIYIWLTYRFNFIRTPTHITWKQLSDQFGADYSEQKNFSGNFKKHLRAVHALYPDAKYIFERGKLILLPSRTSVAARPAASY